MDIFADTGGDTWSFLNLLVPVGIALLGAILGFWVRMEIAIAKQASQIEAAKEDRKNLWEAVSQIRKDNEDCNREREHLKTSVDGLKQGSRHRDA